MTANVPAVAPSPSSFRGASEAPASPAWNDPPAVVAGVNDRSGVDGIARRVWFDEGAAHTGPQVGGLFSETARR